VKRVACWSAADGREILATEATEGSEGRFLAVHLPLSGFEVDGPGAADVNPRDQEGLLRALSLPGLRHAFCVVEGEPGSGKSHLIRWLRVMWSNDADFVLMIQRADGSLDGALRQLRERLPREFVGSLDVLSNVQQVGERGRWRNFLSILANSMASDYFAERDIGDEAWCDERRLKDLFGATVVAERWAAPTRILSVVSGKSGERNSEWVRFTASDVHELVDLQNYLKNAPIAVTNFLRRLKKERETFRQTYEAQGVEPPGEKELEEVAPETQGLVRALNRRLNHALQFFIGIGKDKLKDLFLQLRRNLRGAGRRLVLLLEDITSFQGIDNQLIDAIVTQSTTREQDDLCDLISVVGITPMFFRDYLSAYGNYRGRITHHVRLGRALDSGLQDVAMLRDSDGPVALAARYLRAVRAGGASIEAWYSRVRESRGSDDLLENKCKNCEFAGPCHAAFGDHEGVGLYPFTAHSLRKMFYALSDRGVGGMTLQTPRGLIQSVLAPTLRHPESVEEGRYPGPELDVEALRSSEADGLSEQQRVLLGAVKMGPSDRRRVLRLVAWWGDSSPENTPTADGPTFSSIPKQVFDSFDAPWPAAEGGTTPNLQREPGSAGRDRTPRNDPPVPQKAKDNPENPVDGGRRPEGPRLANPRGPRQPSVKQRLNQLDVWCPAKSADSGDPGATVAPGRLDDHSFWREEAHRVMADLPWQTMGLSPWETEKLITKETCVFEGSQQAKVQNLVLPRASWLVEGLKASLELGDGSKKEPAWLDTLERRYARMLRRLRHLVVEHVRSRTPQAAEGGRWPVEQAMATVLLGRAWLRGATTPDVSPSEQWREILSTEEEAQSRPRSRTEKWGQWLSDVRSQEEIREGLTLATRLRSQSREAEDDRLVFFDASEPARAITALSVRWEQPPLPQGETRGCHELHVRVAEILGNFLPILDALPKKELQRLWAQAQEINELRHHNTIAERVRQVREVVDRFEALAPRLAPEHIAQWRKAEGEWRGGLSAISLREEDVNRIVRSFTEQARQHHEADELPARILAWEIGVRTDVTDQALSVLRSGDKLVKLLVERARAVVGVERGAGSGVSQLRDFGARVEAATAMIRRSVGGPT
jgi:hypothetical protein